MTGEPSVTPEVVEAYYQRLKREVEKHGYFLNPDVAFTKELVRGLIVNEGRYGYAVCPCRLAVGLKEADLDIICPCDYRDPDLAEFGTCFCALYVSAAVSHGEAEAHSIPERRPPAGQRPQELSHPAPPTGSPAALPWPVWRCRVCGYLCARDGPPEVCPICQAKKERFERFL